MLARCSTTSDVECTEDKVNLDKRDPYFLGRTWTPPENGIVVEGTASVQSEY